MGVMGRIANAQYGYGGAPASGSDFYGGGGLNAQLSAQAGLGVGADTSARTTGIIVVVALVLAWIGYHGLKGG